MNELRQFGINPLLHDPLADHRQVLAEYQLHLIEWDELQDLDGLVFAVPHQFYMEMSTSDILSGLRHGGVLMDVKSVLNPANIPPLVHYWSL